eukprot:m.88341 g.88341  ORF g.88341 m.88341 type:complete len:438 (+) comp13622_c1_seq3:537-1850(+)
MTRVTLVCGVRAVGKSSLAACVLQACDGLRIAVITDSIPALNLPGGLSRPPYPHTQARVDLPNGCVCVVPAADVVLAIASLAADAEPFDYILAEGACVGDATDVIERMVTAQVAGPKSAGLWEAAPVDTIVTVIDCEAFPRTMRSHDTFESMGAATARGKGLLDDFNVSEILMEQIEVANVLILNKTDLVAPRYLDELGTFLAHLNPSAKQERTTHGAAALASILGTRLLKAPSDVAYQAGWVQAAKHTFSGRANAFQISLFVFRARRPFHPRRLHDLLENTRKGRTCLKAALRSKGFLWLATRHDRYGNWSHAGREFHADSGGPWFAAIPPALWPADPAAVAEIEADFCDDESIGDRRQELVFIGKKLDQLGLEEALGSCLLTDAEYALGHRAWQDFEDPFPAWPIEELDESVDESATALPDPETVERVLQLKFVA